MSIIKYLFSGDFIRKQSAFCTSNVIISSDFDGIFTRLKSNITSRIEQIVINFLLNPVLIERVKKKKFDKSVLKGFIDICKTKIKNSNDNMNWTECFIELGRKISQIQNGNLRQWDLLQAKTYENEMKKAQQINNNGIAVASWCKDAIKYYKKAKNKIKADKLFKKYSDLCKTIQYATIDGPPYNLQTDIDKLKDFIDKSNNLDVLNEIIYGFIPKYENDSWNELIDKALPRFLYNKFCTF
mgnify:CR=1 FL=1